MKKALRRTGESEDEFVVKEGEEVDEDAEKDSDSGKFESVLLHRVNPFINVLSIAIGNISQATSTIQRKMVTSRKTNRQRVGNLGRAKVQEPSEKRAATGPRNRERNRAPSPAARTNPGSRIF